jgi:heme iron utilization protein
MRLHLDRRNAKEELVRRAAELLLGCRIAALGTLDEAAPSVSMVPYAILDDPLMFIVLTSELAAHTRQMLENPRVALMIVEPEKPAKLPHALARITTHGMAEALPDDHPRFTSARAAYVARFPDMAGLFELGDFSLFTIRPAAMRFVGGFAQATTISSDRIARSVRRALGKE